MTEKEMIKNVIRSCKEPTHAVYRGETLLGYAIHCLGGWDAWIVEPESLPAGESLFRISGDHDGAAEAIAAVKEHCRSVGTLS